MLRREVSQPARRDRDACSLGPGTLEHFKHLVDSIDGFLDLLADPETDFRVKLMDYAEVKSDIFEFCRFYARWLGNPLRERLKAEIYEVLEEAIDWLGKTRNL